MRLYYFILGAGLFLFLCFMGCEKSSTLSTQPGNSTTVSQQDQTTMESLIAQDALFTTDKTALNDNVQTLAKTDTAIMPHGWGRTIAIY